MVEQESSINVPAFKDRTFSLEIFGACFLLQGLLLLLMGGAAILASLAIGSQVSLGMPGDPTMALWSQGEGLGLLKGSMRMGGAVAVFYAVLSFWLGWGSMRARRWACKILADIGLVLTIYGLVSLVALVVGFLPAIKDFGAALRQDLGGMPMGYLELIMFLTSSLIVFVMAGIPFSLWLYYRSANVRATCVARDMTSDWTEASPRKLLPLCVVWAMYATFYGGVFFSFGGPVPVGATVLQGGASTAFGAVSTAWLLVLTWGTFRARLFAWFGGIATAAAVGAQQYFTDPMAMMPGGQDAYAGTINPQEFMDTRGPAMIGGLLMAILITAYLIYVRRYFFERLGSTEQA